ncbi:hypothetical protein EJ04DRAFT_436355 [Polyplosphaeria fusca]|uniref:Secreted protein n=1 Tax=Polyplosphaeria fusca TaxID=682080 RepID=A0A9P4V336_9PLEO|nr:hypothetical protein EJ04DRAFT_436355 [Polyplosphaeria fusca]
MLFTKPSALLLTVLAPTILASPNPSPRITGYTISGPGCPNDSNSVRASSGNLGDTATFTFSQLRGDDTENCQVHVTSTGGSQGWQFAVKEVSYQANVQLKSGSQLDTFTTVYFSENADATTVFKSSIACAGPELKDTVTVRQSTNNLTWSKCIGSDGYPGILNVNARPVINGNGGSFDFKSTTWKLEWRKC